MVIAVMMMREIGGSFLLRSSRPLKSPHLDYWASNLLHPLFSSETTSLMKWEYIKFWNLVRKFRRYSLPLQLSASLLLRRNVESAAPRHRGAPGSAMHLQTSTHQSLRFFTSRWHRQVPSRLPCLERSGEEEWRP